MSEKVVREKLKDLKINTAGSKKELKMKLQATNTSKWLEVRGDPKLTLTNINIYLKFIYPTQNAMHLIQKTSWSKYFQVAGLWKASNALGKEVITLFIQILDSDLRHTF